MKKLLISTLVTIPLVLSSTLFAAQEDEGTTLESGFENLTQEQRAANVVDAYNETVEDEAQKISNDDISQMREDGKGWGEIAQELGLHPSVLGIRNANKVQNMERERNIKSFEGSQNNSSNGKEGIGLKGKALGKSKEKGASGNNGQGKGKGNSGGGKGNGKGKGN